MHASAPNRSRRHFLRQAATAAAAASLPGGAFHPASAAEPDKLEIGFVGLGPRGSELLRAFVDTRQVQATWLCDVDSNALDRAYKSLAPLQVRPPKTTPDLRRILDDRRVRALVIATPDHWHTPAALLALKAGKAVYLESPVSHNPREGELLTDAVRHTRGFLQAGLPLRSVPWIADIAERIRSGEFGPIHFSRAWFTSQRPTIGFGHLAPVPAGLHYELWQGPAPDRPFRDNLLPRNWHWFWHWGTGELGLHGVELLDLARWALQLDCPVRVASAGGRHHFEDDQETPDTQTVTFDFGHHTLVWEHRSCLPLPLDGESAGVAFLGEKASVILGDAGYRILDPKGRELQRVTGTRPLAPHVTQFLDALRKPGQAPATSAEDAVRSTLLAHLGNISHRVGHSLEINPESRQVRDDRHAAALWSRDYRPGWQPTA